MSLYSPALLALTDALLKEETLEGSAVEAILDAHPPELGEDRTDGDDEMDSQGPVSLAFGCSCPLASV